MEYTPKWHLVVFRIEFYTPLFWNDPDNTTRDGTISKDKKHLLILTNQYLEIKTNIHDFFSKLYQISSHRYSQHARSG